MLVNNVESLEIFLLMSCVQRHFAYVAYVSETFLVNYLSYAMENYSLFDDLKTEVNMWMHTFRHNYICVFLVECPP